jgi:hypothetical protein
MTHQIIRTTHGDYEIIETARGFYIQDPAGYQIGTAGHGLFRDEAEAVAVLHERLVG